MAMSKRTFVACWTGFATCWKIYKKCMTRFDADGNTIEPPNSFPVLQCGHCKFILVTHDELTFSANDCHMTKWIHECSMPKAVATRSEDCHQVYNIHVLSRRFNVLTIAVMCEQKKTSSFLSLLWMVSFVTACLSWGWSWISSLFNAWLHASTGLWLHGRCDSVIVVRSAWICLGVRAAAPWSVLKLVPLLPETAKLVFADLSNSGVSAGELIELGKADCYTNSQCLRLRSMFHDSFMHSLLRCMAASASLWVSASCLGVGLIWGWGFDDWVAW